MVQTNLYYNTNALNYRNKTVSVAPLESWYVFEKMLPRNAYILDAGCGSGRDSLNFMKEGHRVHAVDASVEMAALASDLLSQKVDVLSFAELDAKNAYDGVWCSAAMLHLNFEDIQVTLQNFYQSLKPLGILFISFKHGETDGITSCGRYYYDMNDKRLDGLNLEKIGFEILSAGLEKCPRSTEGNRPDWYSILLRKI